MFDVRVERALMVALDAHAEQTRRGSDVPYAVHPLHVALFLSRLDQAPEVVQAGLLHDVVEDCDGWTLERVEAEFGYGVAAIVAQVTEEKRHSWERRKQHAVDSVPELCEGALMVKACDKLHNLQSLAHQLREAPSADEVWRRFRGGRERTLAMSERLVQALLARLEDPLARALREALDALRAF